MLLHAVLPSTNLLDSGDEILLREVLYDAAIIPEYPFLKLQFGTKRSAADLRTICLNWLFVVDNEMVEPVSLFEFSVICSSAPLLDFYFDYEEVDRDDDLNSKYPCPFCQEEFDLVELCCHIDDEHPLEANFGICPICSTSVGENMVGHIMHLWLKNYIFE
uniref:Di19 zinc-binding domain-containing protein n=1 Tax=Cucumis melo TaxID=3656 RepID=A0A9I9CQ14_CUCME